LLENRRLLSGSLPNYANFAHTAGLDLNQYHGLPVTVHHALELTDSNPTEDRSAFYTSLVNVGAFSTTFSFASTKNEVSADGFTFTLQRQGPTACGYDGHDLGYAGIKDSVAVAFNLYNYSAYGSEFGFASKGKVPVTATSMGSLDLHDGDIFTCTITYDGATLSAKVVDTGNGDTFTDSEKINIPAVIGGSSAYVGFTGSTGVQWSTQEITSWSYGYGPTISSLTASPATVTKHVSTLTAVAADPTGTKTLVYDWTEVSAPAGARPATFSTNGTHTDNTTVTVFSNGDYTFQVTVKDKNGFEVTDDVNVVRT
jgi:hypothetical protein